MFPSGGLDKVAPTNAAAMVRYNFEIIPAVPANRYGLSLPAFAFRA
jgi:hypothetical protein